EAPGRSRVPPVQHPPRDLVLTQHKARGPAPVRTPPAAMAAAAPAGAAASSAPPARPRAPPARPRTPPAWARRRALRELVLSQHKVRGPAPRRTAARRRHRARAHLQLVPGGLLGEDLQ